MAKQRGAWSRVNAQLPQHRKARALGRLLPGVERPWSLPLALWLWAIREGYLDGRLEGVTPVEIAVAAEWRGDAEQLVDALVRIGWLEVDVTGTYSLHEWDLYHQAAIEQLERDRAEARERQRQRRAARTQEAAGTLAAGRSSGVPGSPGAAAGAGTLAPSSAGTPAAVESGAEGDEACRDGTSSGERSGEGSHARASFRFVSSRFVGRGPGEPSAGGTLPEPGSLGAALLEAGDNLHDVPDLLEFGAWWSAYPPTPRRPSNRARAWEQWRATRAQRPPLDSMLRRLELQVASPGWLREGGLYVPRAENYLRDARWLEVADPGPPVEPEPIDVAARLAALAAAVPAPFAEWVEPRLWALAHTQLSLERVEERLAALQDELAVSAEADLTDDEREELARRVEAGERRVAATVPPGERTRLRDRFRRQALARLRGLPTLSLFAPEALRGAA